MPHYDAIIMCSAEKEPPLSKAMKIVIPSTCFLDLIDNFKHLFQRVEIQNSSLKQYARLNFKRKDITGKSRLEIISVGITFIKKTTVATSYCL